MNDREEHFLERRVTYTLEHEEKFYHWGECPGTGQRGDRGIVFLAGYGRTITENDLQKMILGPGKPRRVLETPVYEYAE